VEIGPQSRRSNPLYYPIKAQLTVELIRKYRMASPAARAGWTPVLAEIESLVTKMLAVIDRPPAPPRDDAPPDDIGRPYNEPEATLRDHDELVCRTLLAYLDRVAKESGVIVRRLDNPKAAPLFAFPVKVVAEPAAARLYFISEFRFKCLKRAGKERDFSFWQQIVENQAEVAGNAHFAAVWQQGERTTLSDIDQVRRIAGESEIRLSPATGRPR
jgi:hypothetical protein